MAARVRERAAAMLTPHQLAALSADALGTHGKDMTAAEIRELVTEAITLAQQMAFMLGKLAGLDGGGDP